MNEQLTPESRLEKFLSAIAYNTEIPEDRRNRLERWLGAILKRNPPPDAPYDRLELWLKAIYNNADLTTEFSGTEIEFWSNVEKAIESLVVDIEPYQDLHGYDHPWPGGGGKNLLPMGIDMIKNSNTVGVWSGNSYTRFGVTFDCEVENGVVVRIVANGTSTDIEAFIQMEIPASLAEKELIASGTVNGNSDMYIFCYIPELGMRVPDWSGDRSGNDTGKGIDIKPIAGVKNYIRCRILSGTANNQVFYPMIRLAAETDPTFEPYSNICPISGWTGCKVTRMGKNLMPPPTTSETVYGVTYTPLEDGTVVANGTATSWASYNYKRDFMLEPGEYVLSGSPNIAGAYITIIMGAISFNSLDGRSSTFTIEERTLVTLRLSARAGTVLDNAIYRPMLRRTSETDPEFEPYRGETYDISFPSEAGTVYGGTLNVTTGVLTVTHGNIASYNGEILSGRWISSMDVYSTDVSPTVGAQVVYKLASSITYQLTPQEILTLLGLNRISAFVYNESDERSTNISMRV